MTLGEAIAVVMLTAALSVAVTSRGSVARLAWSMVAGLVLIRLAIWYAPSDWRYLASAAIWVSVGVAAIQRGTAASGGLLIISGLCYGAAEWIGGAPAPGNPALVAADLFWTLALFWAALGGNLGYHQGGNVGRGRSGRGYLACDCDSHDQAQARKAMRSE